MDRDELRKAMRMLTKNIKGKDREKLEVVIAEALVAHLALHTQELVIETADDIGMEAFPLMLAVLPQVATDLVQAMIINILGNTGENGIEGADELLKSMQGHLNKPFKWDTKELWKRVQKESMEAIIRGDVDGQKVTLK